jgi:hypothetical protein
MDKNNWPWLSGAFIQFDSDNYQWPREKWVDLLSSMYQLNMKLIILQYLESRGENSVPPESFLAESGQDPVGWILDYADSGQPMKVLVGLRLDKRFEGSEFLNDASKLQPALDDELVRNRALAQRVATTYRLNGRRSFAGWYLPLEIANFRDSDPLHGWVSRLNLFTTELVREVRGFAAGRIAVSPYFNPKYTADPDGLVGPGSTGPDKPPAGEISMRTQYSAFLRGTGIDTVMPQDGVGVNNIPTANIGKCVGPFLEALMRACVDAGGQGVEYWVNVETYGKEENIERLKVQMEVARSITPRMVTFDFPHWMYQTQLLVDYKKLIGIP